MIWVFGHYAYAVLTEGLGIDPRDLKFIYTRDRPPPFKRNHDISPYEFSPEIFKTSLGSGLPFL